MAEEEIIEEKAEQKPVKKKKKSKLPLLIIFLVLGMGTAAALFFFGESIMPEYFSGLTKRAEKKSESVEEKKTERRTERAHERTVEKGTGPVLTLEPFLFNIGGSSSKFAKVSIGIELRDAKVLEEAKKMVPIIRDKSLSVLGSKGAEHLMDVNSRNVLKQELQDGLKDLFKYKDDINAIYITDIIIQ